jgi:conjugal transfer pilus assembly protein TraF
MLTLVALLMQLAPAYASGADPGRLVVASTAPAAALGNSYWRDEERGWFWYEDPAPDEPEKPETKSAPEVKKEPRRASEIVELEKLQKRLEDYRKIAIMRPTEQNVRRYMDLEAKVVRQASYFADVAQRLGWSHSDLDLTLEGRPVNPLAWISTEKNSPKNLVH